MLHALVGGEREFALAGREVVHNAHDAHSRIIARRERLRALAVLLRAVLVRAPCLDVGLRGEAVDDPQRAFGPPGQQVKLLENGVLKSFGPTEQ